MNNLIKGFLIFVLLIINTACIAQSFEGVVKYKMYLDNPNAEVQSDAKFFAILGKVRERKVKFYIKDNHYKSYNKTTKSIEHYDPETNQIYFYTKSRKDTALVVNALLKDERITSSSVSENGETINGIKCKTLVIEAFKAINKFHFNSDYYKVNAQNFERHHYGHQSEYYKAAGAIPLKIEMKNFIRNITWIAVKVKKKKLSDKHFTLPKFNKIEEAEFVFGTFNLYGGFK